MNTAAFIFGMVVSPAWRGVGSKVRQFDAVAIDLGQPRGGMAQTSCWLVLLLLSELRAIP
jgi:hypothetical protein